ncbi:MAG: dTMP kinase, partial [Hyphomicrobiaceae bacterium]|nr:dTMP kinase [Hyphomicrobiaceae bacterium]
MRTRRFITLEGGEGSGKSTQARRLADRLRAAGHEVVLTREPGGAPLAEAIRGLVLANDPASNIAECLLFAAARAEHVAVTIAPALARGAFVVCDRFIDSTRVYQGVLGGIDRSLIATLEQATVAPHEPTLTLMLDLAPEDGLARAVARGTTNRFESNDIGWHRKLRDGFLAIARAEPDRCRIV